MCSLSYLGRQSYCWASALLLSTALLLHLAVVPASAQQTTDLPGLIVEPPRKKRVNVTDTRLELGGTPAENGVGAGVPATGIVGGIVPDGGGITGASTTVISREEIERSPAQTLPAILSREPGVQVQNLFGGVNAARSVVDMRGFGAAASSNTLFLVNGRRIQDLDLVGVDLASIPRESIERIEITRGNSGAVLYGDGAVGGVINIVTRTGVDLKPGGRIDGTLGSFNHKEGNVSAYGSNSGWSYSVFGNTITSDGYRDNNEYRQFTGVADMRYTYALGSFYLNVSADDQSIGLPGHRRFSPAEGIFTLNTNRRGAFSPYDFGDKQGQNGTIGFTRMLAPGLTLIVDGGIRSKEEQAQFFMTTEALATRKPDRAVDTSLTTSSVTPRIRWETSLWGMPVKAIGGFDYYGADYDSERPQQLGAAPIHHYVLTQTSRAFYWQPTITLPTNTDISAGVRQQTTKLQARDTFDSNAPGGSIFDFEGTPLNTEESNRAWHLGIEQRLSPNLALFARMAHSFRVPNVDERVGMVGAFTAPTTFRLRTQQSDDKEAGVRVTAGPLSAQWSYYIMNLTDEIHFRFAPNFVADNTNLDPTRRYGHETIATLQLTNDLRLKGGLAYTQAEFREGLFAGNDVPLVSKWTGNVGLSWDIFKKWLTLDTVVRYVGDRRMDNDQVNLQPLIPAHTTVDVRLGGQIEQFVWSAAVLNVFDVNYFDYAIASPFPFGFQSQLGTYNAYPQPGRTFMVKAGVTW